MIFMKRRFVLIVVGFLAVINGLLVLRLFTAHAAENDPDSGYAQIAVFAKAIQLLRQDYVDDNKTSYHDLVYAAMKGMLASLDPHSQFFSGSTLEYILSIGSASKMGNASALRSLSGSIVPPLTLVTMLAISITSRSALIRNRSVN